MTNQLRLIEATGLAQADAPVAWRLDDQTKALGREGIASARAALRSSRPRYAAPQRHAA